MTSVAWCVSSVTDIIWSTSIICHGFPGDQHCPGELAWPSVGPLVTSVTLGPGVAQLQSPSYWRSPGHSHGLLHVTRDWHHLEERLSPLWVPGDPVWNTTGPRVTSVAWGMGMAR